MSGIISSLSTSVTLALMAELRDPIALLILLLYFIIFGTILYSIIEKYIVKE